MGALRGVALRGGALRGGALHAPVLVGSTPCVDRINNRSTHGVDPTLQRTGPTQ